MGMIAYISDERRNTVEAAMPTEQPKPYLEPCSTYATAFTIVHFRPDFGLLWIIDREVL